jgi:16S rRNA (adenine1518-N6/adenine1519-N6)-dimethyltransferase
MKTGATHNKPRKYFGQHFLHDRNIIDKIIATMAPGSDDAFIEIGPGRGALTRPLLPHAGRLDAIEIDYDLADSLEQEITDPRFTVHRADALKFDFTSLRPAPNKFRLVGNLPYNISSPLLFHFLRQAELFQDIHVMLQKEVVDRMCADSGNRTYGRLTVALAARCRIESLFDIRPGSFTPPPKVDSGFVRLVPDAARRGMIQNEKAFDRLINQAFSMRRKRISNALKGLVAGEDFAAAGIDPGWRAEQIDVDGFIRLANIFASKEIHPLLQSTVR